MPPTPPQNLIRDAAEPDTDSYVREGEAPSGGSCFGFAVQSALSFTLTRSGTGTPLRVHEATGAEPSEVGQLLREWSGKPGETLTTRLYSLGAEHQFWLERVGWFGIDARVPSITVPRLSERFQDPVWRESIMWGTPAAACAVRLGLMSMHAASVDVGGAALLLAAPGTFGKTTLAAAFHSEGYRLLSDDMVTYRLAPEPVVFPGPALLRLRLDVYEQLTLKGIGASHRFSRKIGLVIDESRRGGAAPVPLAGVVLLRRADTGITLTRVGQAPALRDLFALSFGAVVDPAGAFEGLASLVAQVPVWNLERRLDYSMLPQIVDAVIEKCLASPGTA